VRVVAIIQARMGSSRLPGKVLMPLAGQPVLERVIRRVEAADAFDAIAVATSNLPGDDLLADAASRWGVVVVRGDEQDVLARYGLAAAETGADAVMRITADCPLIDPEVLHAMAGKLKDGVDLVTNARRRTFPRGLDAELFSRAALDIMLAEARQPAEREHVTPFLYRHPDRFRIVDHLGAEDHSGLRLTLDTAEDYELLRLIHDAVAAPDRLRLDDIIAILADHPEWIRINAGVAQKEV
jgi:spore coat polysaccharide biosynthesis protein SpsF